MTDNIHDITNKIIKKCINTISEMDAEINELKKESEIKKSDRENDIFNKLCGKPFIAISIIENEDKTIKYEWHIHHMPYENVLFGFELIKKSILEECK